MKINSEDKCMCDLQLSVIHDDVVIILNEQPQKRISNLNDTSEKESETLM